MAIRELVAAEVGWKAVFVEDDGTESVSRILCWAVAGDGEETGDVRGLIVDPSAPERIVRADESVSPSGGSFSRYRFVAPEPIVVPAPSPPALPPAAEPDPAEELAKGFLKRRR